MNGKADAPFGYLLYFAPVPVTSDGRFVVHGTLYRGGLVLQIVRNLQNGPLHPDDLLASAVVTTPGPFVAVLATNTRAPGSLLIANRLLDEQINNFEITRAGWVTADKLASAY
jgi:hypothetical protein